MTTLSWRPVWQKDISEYHFQGHSLHQARTFMNLATNAKEIVHLLQKYTNPESFDITF